MIALRLPTTAPAEYLQQLANVRPNTRMTKDANGQAYHNWCATGSDRRDYFDAEKMCLAAMEIACHYFPPTSFRHGNKPLFIRREWLAEAKLRNLLEQKRRPKE